MTTSVLVSCEYATCAVPGGQRSIFNGHEDELHSLAGWEPGALNLAQAFAMKCRTPLVHGEITRLLIDLEAGEDARWSDYSEKLTPQTRERFANRVWAGYRATLRQRIDEDLRRHDAVVHLLVHTGGIDPGRVNMRVPEHNHLAGEIATAWAAAAHQEHLDARMVAGDIPGSLIRELETASPVNRYAPIRLEVAGEYFLDGKPMRWEACKKSLIQGFLRATGRA